MMGRKAATVFLLAALAFFLIIAAGCGDAGFAMADLPLYPGAAEGESMERSGTGSMRGSLRQFTTTDAFDEVVRFYRDALDSYEPREVSHTSDLGRQTALSMQKKNGKVTVAIQEFTDKGTVNITFMEIST